MLSVIVHESLLFRLNVATHGLTDSSEY